MLFITDSKIATILASNAIVIPTSAILFFAEFRPLKLIRIPLFFNLPTESKQFIINNQIANERAPPSFGAGIEFKCFEVKINTTTKLEVEAGPLANFLLATNKSLRLTPLIASRVRIIRNNNFVMYVGSSYSIVLNGWGLLLAQALYFSCQKNSANFSFLLIQKFIKNKLYDTYNLMVSIVDMLMLT